MGVTMWLVAGLIAIVSYLYLKMKARYRFWEERGVAYAKPALLVGNVGEMVTMKKNLAIVHKEIYDCHPGERMVGMFDFVKPVLLVKDLELIERVLVKDFGSYQNRSMYIDEKSVPLEVSLFNLRDNRWKAIRNKMVPTFTTGKLKGMLPRMVECSGYALTYIEEEARKGDVEVRGVFGMYATDVIGSCAFGLDTRELGKPGSEFRSMGRRLFTLGFTQIIKILFMKFCPPVAGYFKFSFNHPEVLAYFSDIAKGAFEARRKSGESRQDLVQLMLQLLEKGSIEIHTKDLAKEDAYLNTDQIYTTESFQVTEILMISQAISFLQAGFEGISVTMSLFCLEVTLEKEIQEKLRREIEEKLELHGGSLTYEALKDMVYLEMCISETLRKYPIATVLSRMTTRSCSLDGLQLQAGQSIAIPVLAIHHDPSYYPNPEKFDPERFHPDASRVNFTYVPFGEGPRICIGMRFALLEMKIGLAMLLKNYRLDLSPKTKVPVEFSPKNIAYTPKSQILIQMTKIAA